MLSTHHISYCPVADNFASYHHVIKLHKTFRDAQINTLLKAEFSLERAHMIAAKSCIHMLLARIDIVKLLQMLLGCIKVNTLLS